MFTSFITSFVLSVLFLSLTPSFIGGDIFNDDDILNLKGSVKGAVELARDLEPAIKGRGSNVGALPDNLNKNFLPKRKQGSSEFSLVASSGIVFDVSAGIALWEKKSQEERPIASITKLMTALVFLENNPGWDSVYEVKREDRRNGGRIYVFNGERMKVRDLFYLSLVGSANTATIALVKSTGMTEEEFVSKMNQKAKELGLSKTNFVDPVGLSSLNISTAAEVAILAKESFSKEEIREATLKEEYSFKTEGLSDKSVNSTDKLLKAFPDNGIVMTGGKTGYIDLAGFCFVGQFKDANDREIISVILGSDSIDSRFSQTKDIAEWAFDSYIFE